LAGATITSIGGLRASMRSSHEPAGTPFRLAQRTTALEAMIKGDVVASLAHARGAAEAILAAG
jgi:hypothetical protein